MKKLVLLSQLLLLFGCASAVENYDAVYCHDCRMDDMKSQAKSKLGAEQEKVVAVINYYNDEITSFKVTKTLKNGQNTVVATPITTPKKLQKFIAGTIQKIRGLRRQPDFGITVLPGFHSDDFPKTAHNLVGSENNRQMLLNGIATYLETKAANSDSTDLDLYTILKVNRLVADKEIVPGRGIYPIQFTNGSSVRVRISSISTNGSTGNLMFFPKYDLKSLRDSEGNYLPFDPTGLAGERYILGYEESGAENVLAWRKMLKRLRGTSYFRKITCEWEDEHHVACIHK